jgi:short-subunit dehydrogenase
VASLVVIKRKLLRPKARTSRELKETFGGWAVITGASSGIGAEFANILASEGFNVVVTARREPELVTLCENIRTKYNVQTRIVLADLGQKGGDRKIIEAVDDLDVGLFINNAGAGWFGFFRDQEPEYIEKSVQLHCTSMAVLTRLFLEKMRRRKQASSILITSSIGAYFPVPFSAVYSSTKAMVSFFGTSAAFEESSSASNVSITVLEPGATATGFGSVATGGKIRNENRTDQASSSYVVDQALNYVLAKKIVCIPVDKDYFLSVISGFLPRTVAAKLLYGKYKSFAQTK